MSDKDHKHNQVATYTLNEGINLAISLSAQVRDEFSVPIATIDDQFVQQRGKFKS